MMWYNGPRHHNYYRQRRGPRFPWLLVPFLFVVFGGGHLWWLLPAGLAIMFLCIAIQRMLWSATSTRGQQSTASQPVYYQPSVQENAQPYYEPYQQGYQTQAQAQSSTQAYYTPEKREEDPYQAYDQPKAEYPQQMPPM